jgi:hypothetical protein
LRRAAAAVFQTRVPRSEQNRELFHGSHRSGSEVRIRQTAGVSPTSVVDA